MSLLHAGRCLCFGAAVVSTTPVLAGDVVPTTRTPASLVAEPMPPNILDGAQTPATGSVQVWVDLAMPAQATIAMPSPRAAYRHALDAQLQALAFRLSGLGGVELARVRSVRNSIAVELPADAIDAVRRLPGVLQLRPVIHPHRIEIPPPAP